MMTATHIQKPIKSEPATLPLLLKFRLRLDRIQIPIWLLATALLVYVSGSAVVSNFGGEAERTSLVQLVAANPALLMLRGMPQGTGIGSLVFFQVFTYLGLLAALTNTFLAVRHTRADEESGRAELIGSTRAGRTTPSAATVIEALLANLVLVVLVTLAGLGSKLDFDGSITMGLATGAVGVTFLGVGLLAAQLMHTSRGANGVASAAVGVAYLLRALGDASGTASADGLYVTSSWASWLSPIGWGQQTHAYTANNLLPLLLNLGLGGLLIAVAFWIRTNRDLGGSLLGERAGKSAAAKSLSSVLGLCFRLLRGSILGWAIGGAAMGVFAGSLGNLIAQAISGNPSLQSTMTKFIPGGTGSIIDLFVAAMFGLVGILAAACATQVMMRMRQDEVSGTAELLLASPVSRRTWLLGYAQMGMAGILAVVLAAAAAAGIGFMVTDGNGDRIGKAFSGSAAQIPAAAVYLGLMMVIVVLLPKIVVPIGWTLLALGLLVGQLGALIGLPGWARDLSPFTHSPTEPSATADWGGAWWMILLSALLGVIAIALVNRRELTA